MRWFTRIALALLTAVQVIMIAPAGQSQGLQQKAALQAAMMRYIDRQTVGGAYLHVDAGSGKVRGIYPATAHPMILRMGEYFVLCYDFRNREGKKVPVDFYMARKGDSFTVFQSEVANRALLRRLMKEGKVTRAQ